MPPNSMPADSLFDRLPEFPITGHDEVSELGFRKHAGSDFYEVFRGFLRFKARHHPDNHLVFGNAPCPKLLPPWPLMQELIDGNRIARKHPISRAGHTAFLGFIGIRIGNNE